MPVSGSCQPRRLVARRCRSNRATPSSVESCRTRSAQRPGECFGCGVRGDGRDPRALVGEPGAFVGLEPRQRLGDDVEVVAGHLSAGQQVGQLGHLGDDAGAAGGALCLTAVGPAMSGDRLGGVDRAVGLRRSARNLMPRRGEPPRPSTARGRRRPTAPRPRAGRAGRRRRSPTLQPASRTSGPAPPHRPTSHPLDLQNSTESGHDERAIRRGKSACIRTLVRSSPRAQPPIQDFSDHRRVSRTTLRRTLAGTVRGRCPPARRPPLGALDGRSPGTGGRARRCLRQRLAHRGAARVRRLAHRPGAARRATDRRPVTAGALVARLVRGRRDRWRARPLRGRAHARRRQLRHASRGGSPDRAVWCWC